MSGERGMLESSSESYGDGYDGGRHMADASRGEETDGMVRIPPARQVRKAFPCEHQMFHRETYVFLGLFPFFFDVGNFFMCFVDIYVQLFKTK